MKEDIPMIKCILIVIAIISLIGLYLFVWSYCKAASNADDELGYDYTTKEGEYRTFITKDISYGGLKEGDKITYTTDKTEKIKEN